MPWDIAGHGAAIAVFRAALAGGRLGHAYMITGPQGIGKARLAALAAGAILCDSAPEQAPCGVCASCRRLGGASEGTDPVASLIGGTHPDAHWLAPVDGYIRIDQVRSLQAALALRSYMGRYKVCVLDDADGMTEEAQNSMLKCLEEPVGNGVLLLVTHRPGALLPTIRSRCQLVRLQPLPVPELAEYLQVKRAWPAEQARLIASLCEGRAGRALSADPAAITAARDEAAAWVEAVRSERLRGVLRTAYELDKHDSLPDALNMAVLWLRDIWHRQLNVGLPILNFDRAAAVDEAAAAWQDAARSALAVLIEAQRLLSLNANRRLVLETMLMKMQRGLGR